MSGHGARDLSPRRPSSRLAAKAARPALKTEVDMRECWEAFDAPEQTDQSHPDKTMSCTAGIFDVSVQPDPRYGGATGRGGGHAEMHGLSEMLRAIEEKAFKERLRKGQVEVSCTSKPCCARCSIFLGLLGVRARDGTKKSREPMDLTGYSINGRLKRFICKEYGYTEEAIEYIGNIPTWKLQRRLR